MDIWDTIYGGGTSRGESARTAIRCVSNFWWLSDNARFGGVSLGGCCYMARIACESVLAAGRVANRRRDQTGWPKGRGLTWWSLEKGVRRSWECGECGMREEQPPLCRLTVTAIPVGPDSAPPVLFGSRPPPPFRPAGVCVYRKTTCSAAPWSLTGYGRPWQRRAPGPGRHRPSTAAPP